jgi:hypothetical protein
VLQWMPCRTSHRVLAGTAPTRAAGTFSHTTPDRDCASYLTSILGGRSSLWGVTARCRRAKRGSETGRGDPRQIASSRPQVHTAPMAIHSFGKRNYTDLKVRFDGSEGALRRTFRGWPDGLAGGEREHGPARQQGRAGHCS